MIPVLKNAHNHHLSDMDQEILAYFESHLPSAVYMTLEELSNQLYTSNATIVRFCKKLGFNGYHEFKYQLRKELETVEQKHLSSQNLIQHSLASFRDTMDAIDVKKLENISDLLCMTQRSLYIYGSGLSSVAASYLQTILTTLDRACILIEWQSLLEGITSSIRKDAILFIIVAHSDVERYEQILKNAKQRGATMILLTCEENAALSALSDISILTNDRNEQFHGLDIYPRLSALTIIQIIIELSAQKILQNN